MKLAKSGFVAAVIVGLFCCSAMDAEARLRFRRARPAPSCSPCAVSTSCGPTGCQVAAPTSCGPTGCHISAPTSCGPTGCNIKAVPAPAACAPCAPAAK